MRSSTFDQIDQQILDLLIENSRISLIDISEQVGLSRVAVKNRIDALEKSGVIEQYTVILNPEKVADALIAEEAVTDVYLMTGASKLHVHAVLEMNQDLEHFVLEKLYPLPGIERVSSDLIVSRIKTRKGIRV